MSSDTATPSPDVRGHLRSRYDQPPTVHDYTDECWYVVPLPVADLSVCDQSGDGQFDEACWTWSVTTMNDHRGGDRPMELADALEAAEHALGEMIDEMEV